MKNILKIVVLLSFFCSINSFAQTKKGNSSLSSFILGTWTVNAVDGKLFIKLKDKPGETPIPLGMWRGKNFIFSKGNQITIKDGDNTFFSGVYVLKNNKIIIPKLDKNFEMILVKNGADLQVSQSPNTFYSLLVKQSKKSLTEVKEIFRIPGDITFNLTK